MSFSNRVKVATATVGTGPLTLGQAKTGFASFAEGGVVTGDRVAYVIENGSSYEIGQGVYTSSTQTLTRARVLQSKIDGSAPSTSPLSLTGASTVFLTATATDLRNLGAYFSVERFGAVGNGSTNDAAAFQAAVDAAAASSIIKRVYVPNVSAGYALGATVNIPSGVVIFGDNRKGLELSRIKPTSGFSGVLLKSSGYSTGRVLRIGIEGLFIDGSSTTLVAIDVRCQESVICGNTIKNCFTYGIKLSGFGSGASEQALNNLIADNYLAGTIGVTEFFDGLYIDYNSADNTINRNYIEACKDAGIRSRGYNNKITNNHIYSVSGTGGGVGAGIYTETSADHDISQNYIELCAAEGVLMQGGGSDVATLAAAVHGNVFRNVDTGNTSNGVIEISGSDVSAVSVTGNVVRRDAATTYATPYFCYFNGITPTLQTVIGNSWQSGLVTVGESNLPNTFSGTPQSIVWIGADTFSPLTVDAGSSTLDAKPAVLVTVPATGAQKAFNSGRFGESTGWVSIEGATGGAAKPGIAFGSGAAPRDTALYRDAAASWITNSAFRSTLATGGIGYATGAGGAVTQATSKSTGVTLNTVAGQITMNAAALAAGAIVSFVLTNSAIAAGDVLILNHISGGTAGAYGLNAQTINGFASISVRNATAGSLSEAIVIAFAVIRAVSA